jgi:uncharacterized membrane protein YbhN (UPF0104 family)
MTSSNQFQPPSGVTLAAVARRLSKGQLKPTQALKWLTSILLLVGVIVFIGLNYNFSGYLDDVRRISPLVLALVLLSLFGNALAASLRFQAVATQIGHRVTFRHAMAAVGAGSVAGALFFQIAGQLIGRGFVMARAAVPFASVVVLTAYERIVAAIVSALLAFAGAYFIFGNVYLDQNAGGGTLIKIMLGLFAATGAGALLGYGRLAASSIAPWLTKNFATGFLQLVALTVIVQMPMMLAYVLASHALSPQTPIPDLTASSAIVMFAASVPISLAGWGVREMSTVVALGAIGVAPQAALLTAVIIGAGSMISMFVLAGVAFPGSMRRIAATEDRTAGTQIDFLRALVWAVPIGVAILVFFQIYVPLGSGTLLNVNLADPLAILGGVLFVLAYVQDRKLPQWRYRYMNEALVAASLVLTLSLFIGASRFGWTDWAVVNRYWGWYILLAYAGSGALLTRYSGREGLRILLLSFAGACAAIAVLEILLLTLYNLGIQTTLPLLPSELEGFSQNHNFFAFQLLMTLAAVFVAVRGQSLRVGLIALLLATLFFSASRSSWITVIFVLAASIYMNAATGREIVRALLFALAVIAPILVAGLLFGHADSTPTPFVGTSNTETRMMSIIGGLKLFVEHPLLGAGLGAFRNKLIIYEADQPLLIHSTSVWLLAELGIVGLITFATPAVYALIAELRRRYVDSAGQLIVLCLVGFGVMSLPADMLYQRTFWLLFGAALMLKSAVSRDEAQCASTHQSSCRALAGVTTDSLSTIPPNTPTLKI